VATVDSEVIRVRDVKHYHDFLKMAGSSAQAITSRQILDMLIETSAKLSLVKKNGWDAEPAYQHFLNTQNHIPPEKI